MAFWAAAAPALISAAGSVAGGLLSKKGGKRIKPKQIRKEALEGGFNPLTVLRASAGGGFGYQSSGVPQLSSAGVIAEAIAGGAAQYFRNKGDPVEQETARLENQLLRVQIDAAREATRKNQRQPLARRGVEVVGTSPSRRGVPGRSGLGILVEPEPRVQINPGGSLPQPVVMGKNPMSVASAEEGYGEGGEFFVGAYNAWDYAWSRQIEPWMERRKEYAAETKIPPNSNDWLMRQLRRPVRKDAKTYDVGKWLRNNYRSWLGGDEFFNAPSEF